MVEHHSVQPDILRGRVAWVFPDDFDVDLIIGVENVKYSDPEVLKPHCMKSFDENFAEKVQPGDVIVAGSNFGYGHPHYPPMIVLRALGITAVAADSFSPGFWRGETYNGMPLITAPGISKVAQRFDEIHIDWRNAAVRLPERGIVIAGEAPSQRTIEVLEAGGKFNLLLRQAKRHGEATPAHAAG